MASNTRTVDAVPSTVFDFNSTKAGTVSFFSNDLNINFAVLVTPSVGNPLRLHAGPILFTSSFQCGGGCRIQLTAQTIGNAFPPPPLSLVQLQTDTIPQAPGAEET